MGLGLDDLVEDLGVPALVLGVGAALLAPVLLPIGKPLAKSAIKAGLALYEKSKGAFAEMGEAFEDLVAESKAELAEAQSKKQLSQTAIVPAQSRAITQ